MNAGRQKLRRWLIVAFFLLLPVTLNYYSPALMTQGTAERVATFSLFFWALVFVTSLLVGRAFCGWGCPFHGLQLAWEKVSSKPTRQVRYVRWIKYALWIGWVGAVVAFAVATGGWDRIDLLYMMETPISVEGPENLIVYYALVLLTLAPAGMGKRGFCHYFCPFGVWSIVGEKLGAFARIPRLKLDADAHACTQCGNCTRTCPMDLPVSDMVAAEEMRHTECILCGSCVDGCTRGGATWGFGRVK